MNGGITLNYEAAAEDLARLDESRQNILNVVKSMQEYMEENTKGATGKKADEFRLKIVNLIGSSNYPNNSSETLKKIYEDMNNLNYEVKTTIQRAADIDGYNLNIRSINAISADRASTAWNFEAESKTENLHIFSGNELYKNLSMFRASVRALYDNINNYKENASNLSIHFATDFSSEIDALASRFTNIASQIESEVTNVLDQFEGYGQKMTDIVKDFGAKVSDI